MPELDLGDVYAQSEIHPALMEAIDQAIKGQVTWLTEESAAPGGEKRWVAAIVPAELADAGLRRGGHATD